jgi:hypothetical protein
MATTEPTPGPIDEMTGKGASEDDGRDPKRIETLKGQLGQLGHRDQDEMLKDNDTDFPEPDAKAEHSGK